MHPSLVSKPAVTGEYPREGSGYRGTSRCGCEVPRDLVPALTECGDRLGDRLAVVDRLGQPRRVDDHVDQLVAQLRFPGEHRKRT